MGASGRLDFDPAATTTSSSVGAYVLAGNDGDQIASQNINSEDWLNTSSIPFRADGTVALSNTTTGALDVHVVNSVTVNDAALADTAIENTATAVSLIAVNVVGSALSNRKYLWLANEGTKQMFWGKTGVTIVNGFPLAKGERHDARVGPSVAPQIIGASGSSAEDIRVMEFS